ncbi:unnamed protein product [Parnassius apollo]|uniref:(apollo) hypothetical protein n=1 Tax=Parnassius apollo TaxID=110799 RepID=A0A8S3WPM0_PARAO|nr:unnamed protein product [Parnassius apollo]
MPCKKSASRTNNHLSINLLFIRKCAVLNAIPTTMSVAGGIVDCKERHALCSGGSIQARKTLLLNKLGKTFFITSCGSAHFIILLQEIFPRKSVKQQDAEVFLHHPRKSFLAV